MRTYEEWWKALRWTFLKATNEIEKFSKNTIACKILDWHSHYLKFQPRIPKILIYFLKATSTRRQLWSWSDGSFPGFELLFKSFLSSSFFLQIWCRLCDEEHLWNLWQPKHRTGDLHLLTFHDCPSYVFLGDQQRDTLGVFDGNERIRWEQQKILNINRC